MSNSNARDGHRSMIGSIRSHFRRSDHTQSSANNPIAELSTDAASLTSSNTAQQGRPPLNTPPRNHGNILRPTRRPGSRAVTEAPPPPYSAPSPANRRRSGLADGPAREDRYAFLSKFDTIFLIDDSESMDGPSWDEVRAVLANIAPICTTYDEDGIDIYFLNHYSDQRTPLPGKATGGYNNIRSAHEVAAIFNTVQPRRATPTASRLREILHPYLLLYEDKLATVRLTNPYGSVDPRDVKPINVIVITDGEPDDDLGEEIIAAAKKLDKFDAPLNQVGIQFFQVGKEEGASSYFQILDDDLGRNIQGGLRDIVDTVTWDTYVQTSNSPNATPAAALSAEGILKVVLGAVVRRLDRQPTVSVAAT